jgi:hypothetical protein
MKLNIYLDKPYHQSNIAEQLIPLELVTPATKTIMLNAQKLNYKWLPGPIKAMTNWTNITYYEISSYVAPNYTLNGLITSNQVKKSACTRPLVHVKPIYKTAQANITPYIMVVVQCRDAHAGNN